MIQLEKKNQQKKTTINMKRNLIAFALVLLCSKAFGQESSKVLLINGFLHVGNGETIESALIGIEDGEIILVKNLINLLQIELIWFNLK